MQTNNKRYNPIKALLIRKYSNTPKSEYMQRIYKKEDQ